MRFINDAGHGWLEVSLVTHPEAINYGTGFGYIDTDREKIYLEEDCEALAYLRWLFSGDLSKARLLDVCIVEGDSPIRALPHNENRLQVA
jgi:hypothetical protein